VLQVVLLAPIEFIHPLEGHEHLFHKAVIDRIVLREMVAAIFGGKRIKIDGLLAVNLNLSNVVYESQIPVAKALVDIRTQNTIELPEYGMTRPEGDWDLVHGELMTFFNPGFDLPPIDRLEAFDPNGRSMYQRVLVVAEYQDRLFSCWTYHGLDHILRSILRLPRGYWDGKKFG